MNEASLKYTAYKALLEGDITREQYDFITEAGLVSRIIKSLKAAGGAAAKTYKDETYIDVQQYASQQLQKIVKQIYQAGAKAGQDKDQIAPVVAMILNQAMVDSKIENPALVFRALDKNPEALEAVSEPSAASSGGESSSVGTTITTDMLKSNPRVTAALAAAVLPDKKDAIEAAVKKGKKIPSKFLYTGIAALASKSTGVNEDVALKIVTALVDAERLKASDSIEIEAQLESVRTRHSGNVIFERWQILAGVRGRSLLTEVDVPDDIKQALGNDSNAKKFISNLEGDKTVSSGLIKKVKSNLKTSPDLLPKLEDLISQVNVKPGNPEANKDDTEVSSAGTEDQSSKKEDLLDKESKDLHGGSEDYETYKNISDQDVEKMRNSDDKELRGLGFYIKANRALMKAYEKGGDLFDAIRGDEDSFIQAFDKFLADNDIKRDEMDAPPDSGDRMLGRYKKLQKITRKAYVESQEFNADSSKEDSKEGSGENNSESQGSDSSGEDLGKIKPILDDIRKKVPAEEASDKDVVAVLKYIKDEIEAVELITTA